MKLLAQTNRRYLLISLAALMLSSVVLFLELRSLFYSYTDERLEELETEVTAYVQTHDTLPVFFQSTSSRLLAQRTDLLPARNWQDTTLLNELEQEMEPFRQLRFGLSVQGQAYQIDIFQSTVETEDIAEIVLFLNLALLAVMFLTLFWVQKRMSAQLWKPFYETLDRLRGFQLNQQDPLELTPTDTDEFAELNATLERLSEKTRQDYHALKRFTENASHEIQTPLAVIRAKLETLIQSEGLSQEQLAHLHQTQQAAARLSRLQQNLLLLVKIENYQFQAQEILDVPQLIARKLEQLEDFIEAKKLHVQTELLPLNLPLNPFLTETLIGNLIGNTVKHNVASGGWISIQLNEKSLILRNSGLAPEVPPTELLERFRRSNVQAEGLGLGLAIAQEICEQYAWQLEIGFEDGIWEIRVRF